MNFSKIFKTALLFAAAFLFLSAKAEDDFLAKSERDFSQEILQNKIPVAFKADSNAQTVAVCLIVKGERAAFGDSGDFRDIAATLLTCGSQNYSPSQIKKILYEKEASFSSSATQNGVTLSYSCLSGYSDALFDIFQDAFLRPLFDEAEFEKAVLNAEVGRENALNSPFSLLQAEIDRAIYKGHPYENSRYFDERYADFLREGGTAKLREIHKKFLNAARLEFVVAGNFSKPKMLKKLNAAFGALLAEERPQIEIPQVFPKGEPKIVVCPASDKSFYAAKVFAAPHPASESRIDVILAAQIFDEILFNVAREKNGLCYSVFNSLASSKASYGATFAYMANDANKIPAAFEESCAIMRQKKVIDGKDDSGEFLLSPLEDSLEGYKNSYINAIFSSLETPQGCAARIASDILFFGDAKHYFGLAKKIKAVSANGISKAFDRYFDSADFWWFIVCGEESRGKIDAKKFTASK